MKVLIAEDDAVSRRLLRSYLERWGHEVVEASDGGAALGAFQAAEFGLVVSDWMMPVLDGVELTRRIRRTERSGYVYIILLTAKSQKQDLVEGMEAGADDFITKPFDRDELRVRVQAGERIIRLERDLAAKNRSLREAQAALVQREKFAGIGRLALGISHELTHPLTDLVDSLTELRRDMTGVLHVVETYQEAIDPPADPRKAEDIREAIASTDLARINETARPAFDRCLDRLQAVQEIVRNLRDFAHVDEFLMRSVDLSKAAADVIAMLGREIDRKQARIETHFASTPRVHANTGKIKKVILNLLTNSLEAIGTGGAICVRTGGDGSSHVLMEIEDDGVGISDENLPHLFDPFFTTKQETGQVGLGLSIAHAIIQEHGGSIEVISPRAQGSRFRIRLPIQPSMPVREDLPKQSEPAGIEV